MHILIINPNTNPLTTRRIAEVASSIAMPTTKIEVISAQSGIMAIENPKQSTIAAPIVVRLIAEQAEYYDVTIIAAFSDPGLFEARKITSKPVIGIAESAMLKAAEFGPKFSIITLGEKFRDLIKNHAEACGIGNSLANIRFLPWSVSEVGANQGQYLEAFRLECERAIEEDGAKAIIIGGGPLSGMAVNIVDELSVPVLDGVACATQRAETIVIANN